METDPCQEQSQEADRILFFFNTIISHCENFSQWFIKSNNSERYRQDLVRLAVFKVACKLSVAGSMAELLMEIPQYGIGLLE